MSKEWALVGSEASEMHSVWSQLDYWIPGFNPVAGEFSDVSEVDRLPETAPAEYYARRGVDLEPLRIPSALGDYFEAYERSYQLAH